MPQHQPSNSRSSSSPLFPPSGPAPNKPLLLEVQGLSKRYDSVTAVDSIDFAIRQGEIFGLLGPNGAGKTTTISMLAGILPASAGTVRIHGQPAGRGTSIRHLLGVVPQELAIYNRLTARENLHFFGTLYGLRGAALHARADDMLRLVGLSERGDDRAETYSGGMKRRLNLAVGLMHSPQLLLLDEPTVGVDPQSRNHIFEGVRALNRSGLTVLYTSHYMEEVQALCARVAIMDGGKIIACGRTADLIAQWGVGSIELGITTRDAAMLPSLVARLITMEHIEGVEPQASSANENAGSSVPSADTAAVSAPSSEAGARLLVRTRRPDLALPGVLATLTATHTLLLSLNVHQASLESVFLALTGKTLRD